MKEIGKFFSDILKFGIKVFIVLFLITLVLVGFSGTKIEKSGVNLAEIKLSGAIMDESAILKEIYSIQDDKNIKAVLLNINSPGGAFAPSFEISNAIKELNKEKPVITYASGTMASGSYLSGVWANKIYANKGSFIGSIGVIMQGYNIEELASKIGIKDQVVKAGEFKEAGTIMRAWSESERQSLQDLVDKSYDLFVSEVATARKLNKNDENLWANARVFLPDEALNLGLIDEISNYKKVKDEVVKISGVQNPVWKEKSKYDEFMDTFSSKVANLIMSEFSLKVR
ncbi:signal peptide peptidase SppA [Campylobacter ureolyticus]|uniref:Signal peptide peptidase SppA n=2 Tax=Campylobacter ureolyticus TaxID=827 RepID=A0A9Q4PT44_9BACT|nr:signal peptide peptidase SppA [Campylobacter ureolyticus]MCZ6160958.1 signal peptide peptidase SppA [Campylobacter ureolyticus]MCZ6169934.1 signal peptide peptidase SppA [Campylobacter ureolyticus]MDU4981166.1 signal peptide peptidase SppA [Campylobacter ureolyticus]